MKQRGAIDQPCNCDVCSGPKKKKTLIILNYFPEQDLATIQYRGTSGFPRALLRVMQEK